MCTIIVLNRVHPEYPVVVAANRDEFYARASSGPRVLSESPHVVGGRDEELGGTWMGVSREGLFVGLTNQRSYAPRTRAPRSRGHVVLEALRTETRDGVRAYLEALDTSLYESFNLIYGDADGLEVAYVRRDVVGVEVLAVDDGVTVLSNDRVDADDFPKLGRARALVEPIHQQPFDELAASLRGVLADHQVPERPAPELPKDAPFEPGELRKLQALCVHTGHYGTRSSTVAALRPGGVARYLYAPGAPCVTEWHDATGVVTTV